jgi:hypothetical protein
MATIKEMMEEECERKDDGLFGKKGEHRRNFKPILAALAYYGKHKSMKNTHGLLFCVKLEKS